MSSAKLTFAEKAAIELVAAAAIYAPMMEWRKLELAILEKFNEARELHTPTQFAYDAACKARDHWKNEADRLAALAGVKPRGMVRLRKAAP